MKSTFRRKHKTQGLYLVSVHVACGGQIPTSIDTGNHGGRIVKGILYSKYVYVSIVRWLCKQKVPLQQWYWLFISFYLVALVPSGRYTLVLKLLWYWYDYSAIFKLHSNRCIKYKDHSKKKVEQPNTIARGRSLTIAVVLWVHSQPRSPGGSCVVEVSWEHPRKVELKLRHLTLLQSAEAWLLLWFFETIPSPEALVEAAW